MGCNCGSASSLISQEMGSAYYYVRLVADNLQLLQNLAAQLQAEGNVIDIARGTTAALAHGVITADVDNSHIAVAPESGTADELTTIDGDPNGRVIVIVPAAENQTLTIKGQTSKPITAVDPPLNEFTVVDHDLVTGQPIILSGPGLPVDVAPGAYYAVAVDTDTFKIATTKANALAGTIVEIVNEGTGVLNIGNIKIEGDLELTGRNSATLVKDGTTYTLLSTSAVLPTLVSLLAGFQPISDLLTSVSQLALAAQAGKILQVNETEDGFEPGASSIADILAVIANKAPLVHGHSIDSIDGLVEALGGLQPSDADLTAIAGLATTAFGRSLLTLADINALRAAIGGAVAPVTSVPAAPTGITLLEWTSLMKFRTAPLEGATSYRWRIYAADGVTLKREVTTTLNEMEYTSSQAHVDGIARAYKVQVAGVNSLGVGDPYITATMTKAAPAAPTGVLFADGASSSTVTFTPPAGSSIAGYRVAYSTASGFNPMTQGSLFNATTSPAYTPVLPAATYYGKVAAFDAWTQVPDLLNFSAQDPFVISVGGSGSGSTPPGGDGGGGATGGGGGSGGAPTGPTGGGGGGDPMEF